MPVLNELEEASKGKKFEALQVFNPKGKDLVFKGVELIRLENRNGQILEGLPLDGSICVYITDNDNFVIVDDRKLEQGPMVIGRFDLQFGCIGYDRVAKELYRLLGIDAYQYV